jgi:drug/metabolite transporter (DMT)-like permease
MAGLVKRASAAAPSRRARRAHSSASGSGDAEAAMGGSDRHEAQGRPVGLENGIARAPGRDVADASDDRAVLLRDEELALGRDLRHGMPVAQHRDPVGILGLVLREREARHAIGGLAVGAPCGADGDGHGDNGRMARTGNAVVALTTLAMVAFAGNSLLCRVALRETPVDAATFTTVRIVSGAVTLWLIAKVGRGSASGNGTWASAFWLFAYAAGFSFAYLTLTAATGALLLFGAVQATMMGYALWRGERWKPVQVGGLCAAFAGLAGLLLPGASAPAPLGAALMIFAGISWGIYSLRGRGAGDATLVTAGNFARAVPFAIAVSLAMLGRVSIDWMGIGYAVASGAVASGIGYAIWYTALPHLKAGTAATVQLSVPVIAAVGGVLLLGEPITMRLVACSAAILGGIAVVTAARR